MTDSYQVVVRPPHGFEESEAGDLRQRLIDEGWGDAWVETDTVAEVRR